LLAIRRGLVDRRRDRPGRLVRFRTRMNRDRVELIGHRGHHRRPVRLWNSATIRAHVFGASPTAPRPGRTVAMLLSERLNVWKTAYTPATLPVGMPRPPDSVSKWLVITRAAVFSMTVTSGLIGGLLAVGAERLTGEVTVNWGYLLLAVVGLVVAHASNNMINDYFDLEGGIDTDGYVRAQYAPHPILSGWVSNPQLGPPILLTNAIDLAILTFFVAVPGPLGIP